MRKSWVAVCLFNFTIAALMGTAMRLSNVVALDIDYAKLIHAHSHTAMLGWVYLMLYCLLVQYFVPAEKQKNYRALFWITQIAVVGMMISFPIQGYALCSIAFSTMHIVCGYVFCYRIWKDNNADDFATKTLLRTALAFMVISTIGALSLGGIVNAAGKDSPLYKSAIQFFLHFQFNGWFEFAVLAIFFALLHRYNILVNRQLFSRFYYCLLCSAIVSFALPLSWHFHSPLLFAANVVGILLQIASVVYFIKMTRSPIAQLSKHQNTSIWLLWLALFSFAIKTAMQALTILPVFSDASFKVRNFTVGFIHLGMLGLITGFLFFFLTMTEDWHRARAWKIGIALFFTGFVLTELILFAQGLNELLKRAPLPYYPETLLGASLLLPTGLLFILWSIIKVRRLHSASYD